jgi:protein-S-isoprenylcysteine O-methyltransferase Ste14
LKSGGILSLIDENLTFSQRGGWWVVGQFLILLLILIVPGPGFPAFIFNPGFYHLFGASLIGIASFILFSGAKSLWIALTPYPYPIANAPLIREGIYKYVRHPLYFGLILGGFGVSIWRTNFLALGLSMVLPFYLNAKANLEERWLLQKFPDYDSYRKRTKKLIPFLY